MMRTPLALVLVMLVCGCASPFPPDTGRRQIIPTRSQISAAKSICVMNHPRCMVCNVKRNIVNGNRNEAHHVIPEHVDLTKAADLDNLRTLCRTCHFWVGHMGNWRDFNGNLDGTIEAVRKAYGATATRIVSDD